ncbi:MAG: GNAT family N-acetyltransferase [Chitinophagaceae bacterium]
MTIRRVVLEDAETLSKLGADTFFDTFTGTCTDEDMSNFLADYFNIEQVKKELSDADDFFYFAEVDGRAVGYLRIKEDYKSFETMKQWKALELKRLYISKDFHGKGVAQALTNLAFDFAKENSYEVIWLGVWEHNYRAQRFYQKMGFEDSGHSHDFPIGNTPQTDFWYWKFLNRVETK